MREQLHPRRPYGRGAKRAIKTRTTRWHRRQARENIENAPTKRCYRGVTD